MYSIIEMYYKYMYVIIVTYYKYIYIIIVIYYMTQMYKPWLVETQVRRHVKGA